MIALSLCKNHFSFLRTDKRKEKKNSLLSSLYTRLTHTQFDDSQVFFFFFFFLTLICRRLNSFFTKD